MGESEIKADNRGVMVEVKVVPGSSRTEIAGFLGDRIKIKVAAAPEKGKANAELVRFLAAKLGIKKRQVQVVSGQSSAIKQVRIEDMVASAVLEGLGLSWKR
jgi:hypothetical protein